MSIYVEILVHAPMESLWEHTQMPALHERWDLRFSRIDYLPKSDDREPQRFRDEAGFAFQRTLCRPADCTPSKRGTRSDRRWRRR